MSTHTQSLTLPDLQRASAGGDGTSMVPAMELALQASFSGLHRWRTEFIAMASAAPEGMPWTLLSFRPSLGALVNHRSVGPVQTHSEDLPILAFQTTGGPGLADAEAFASGIDWAKVYERYQVAVHDASEAFGATQDELASVQVLDVRRAGMFDKADSMIPGAQWRDPATVGSWSAQLPKDQPVVVYCIYGHEVGRSTAMRLRAQGISARFLDGGIDAWQAAGRPVVPKLVPKGAPS